MAKSISRRNFLGLLAAGTGGVFLASCSQPAPAAPTSAPAAKADPTKPAAAAAPAVKAGEKAKISFGWPFSTGDKWHEAAAKAFMEKNKNIEVEIEVIPQAQVLPKLTTAFSGGAAPDCLGMSDAWLSQFSNYLQNLDQYLAASGLDKDILPSSMKISKMVDGNPYYAGFILEAYSVYYNKQMLADAGFKEAPKDLEEFRQAAIKMTDASKNKFGYYLLGGSGWQVQQWSHWMIATGGLGPENKWFDASGKCLFRTPKHVEGLQKWLDLYQKDKVSPAASATATFQDAQNAFNAGQIGMAFGWGGYITSLAKGIGADKFGVAAPPAGPAGQFFYYAGNGYCVNKDSKNKDAAWEFLKFLLEPANNADFNKNDGCIPANSKAWNVDWLKDPRYQAPMELLKRSDSAINHPRYLPEYASFQIQYAPEQIQKALLGQQTAQQHGEACSKYMEDMLAKFGKTS